MRPTYSSYDATTAGCEAQVEASVAYHYCAHARALFDIRHTIFQVWTPREHLADMLSFMMLNRGDLVSEQPI